MTAFNVVRMKPKSSETKGFLDYHQGRTLFDGMRAAHVVDTGGGEYLLIGEWESMDALAAARPQMIATLDGFRDKLEDLGGDLGLTDPHSGEAVVSLTS